MWRYPDRPREGDPGYLESMISRLRYRYAPNHFMRLLVWKPHRDWCPKWRKGCAFRAWKDVLAAVTGTVVADRERFSLRSSLRTNLLEVSRVLGIVCESKYLLRRSCDCGIAVRELLAFRLTNKQGHEIVNHHLPFSVRFWLEALKNKSNLVRQYLPSILLTSRCLKSGLPSGCVASVVTESGGSSRSLEDDD